MADGSDSLAIARQVISIAQLEGNEELLMTLVFGDRGDIVENLLDVQNPGLTDRSNLEELAGLVSECS